ncbi:MAG: nicotinamide mononucleotide transporter [Bacteroidetes bacterium]|nr:nicotinamide mononucleotide transporter [Bacteroidota bacterium]
MNNQDWLSLFTQQVQKTPRLEWIAVIMGVAEVLLAQRNNVLLYPTGIISTIIYIYIMSDAGLYAESGLNVYYLVMSVYGWYHWIKRKNEPPLPVTHNNKKDWSTTIAIVGVGWLITYIILHRFTSSTVPVWDSWVSATAWAGMWLLAKRKIENWLLLNLSNIFAIPLLVYKQLPLTACLTLFLFIVAIFGYFRWKKLYREQQLAS